MAKISIEKKKIYQSRSIDETGKKLREKGTVMLHISIGFNRKKIPNYLILIAVSLNLADLQKWIKLNCFFFYFEFNSNSLPSEIETEWGGEGVWGADEIASSKYFAKIQRPINSNFRFFLFHFLLPIQLHHLHERKKKNSTKNLKRLRGKEERTKPRARRNKFKKEMKPGNWVHRRSLTDMLSWIPNKKQKHE